jgi:hypothetical protein
MSYIIKVGKQRRKKMVKNVLLDSNNPIKVPLWNGITNIPSVWKYRVNITTKSMPWERVGKLKCISSDDTIHLKNELTRKLDVISFNQIVAIKILN